MIIVPLSLHSVGIFLSDLTVFVFNNIRGPKVRVYNVPLRAKRVSTILSERSEDIRTCGILTRIKWQEWNDPVDADRQNYCERSEYQCTFMSEASMRRIDKNNASKASTQRSNNILHGSTIPLTRIDNYASAASQSFFTSEASINVPFWAKRRCHGSTESLRAKRVSTILSERSEDIRTCGILTRTQMTRMERSRWRGSTESLRAQRVSMYLYERSEYEKNRQK